MPRSHRNKLETACSNFRFILNEPLSSVSIMLFRLRLPKLETTLAFVANSFDEPDALSPRSELAAPLFPPFHTSLRKMFADLTKANWSTVLPLSNVTEFRKISRVESSFPAES